MTRKRNKPYLSRHTPSSLLPKRPRFTPSPSSNLDAPHDQDAKPTRQSSAAVVVVTGLSRHCSVLNLKSRFQMYGCVSRLRIDHGVGFITFRSKDSADAAIAAASDPLLGITIDSQKVEVSLENDNPSQWRERVGFSSTERPTSKLLLPEIPLSKRGRGNKLGSGSVSPPNRLDSTFKGRDIVAYDDLF